METLSRKRSKSGLLRFTKECGLGSSRANVISCELLNSTGVSGVRLGGGTEYVG